VYQLLQKLLDREREADGAGRLIRAVVLLLLGLSVGTGVAAADTYLHRGIESSAAPPFVLQSTGREPAINVDLTLYEPNQIEQISVALRQNGYRYVRQTFDWSVIEPQPGLFIWDRYDVIVDQMQAQGIGVIAVLHRSPSWARAPEQTGYSDAPPATLTDYQDFVEATVNHFGERLQFYQIWDLPNRADRWGGAPADPVSYSRLLASGFNGVRGMNSEAKVVLAELDPAYPNGAIGADLTFLRGIYEQGGADIFDILAVRLDGGVASPFDRQIRSDLANFSRVVLFRELAVEEGDGEKPVWVTHFGWNGGDGGKTTRQEQSDFILAAIDRARAEWPWLGLMFNWSLLPDPNALAEAGFALLDQSGTGTPAFAALSTYSNTGGIAIAATGFVPMDSPPITYTGNWENQQLNRQILKTTAEIGASATVQFRGTGVTAFLRYSPSAGSILATIDGNPIPGWPVKDGASLIDLGSSQAADVSIPLADGLADETHVLTLTLAERGQFTVGGVVVSRDQPLLWPVIVLIVIAVAIVAIGLRDVIYVIAIESRTLERTQGAFVRPRLPKLPDWQPSRRF
jgi:Beta-galactosidase